MLLPLFFFYLFFFFLFFYPRTSRYLSCVVIHIYCYLGGAGDGDGYMVLMLRAETREIERDVSFFFSSLLMSSLLLCYFCRPPLRSFLERRLKKQQHLVSLTTSTFGGDIGVLSLETCSSSCELITYLLKESKQKRKSFSWFFKKIYIYCRYNGVLKLVVAVIILNKKAKQTDKWTKTERELEC
jgi:hypothetical protein